MGSLLDDAPVVTATDDYPELCIEVLWNQGPFAADGEWCDITGYVSGGTIQIGRQYELERFQSGTFNFTLLSSTRLFDPEWSSGPFQPWLTPGRQVRVSAVWNGTRYPLYRGQVEDWGTTTLSADNQFVTDVAVKDVAALFDAMTLPGSWYELIVGADTPAHWWKLDEASGTVAVDSGYASTIYNGAYVGGPTLAAASIVAYDGGRPCVTFDGGGSEYVNLAADLATDTNIWELWFSKDAAPAATEYLLSNAGVGWLTDPDRYLAITSSGYIKSAGRNGTITGAVDLCDGQPHHVVFVRGAAASTDTLYVDGASIGTVSSILATTGSGFRIGIGNPGDATSAFEGTISHVALWASATALSAAQILAHYTAGTSAFSGDDTGAYLERVLDAKGWPATLRSIDTGASTIGAYELAASMADHVGRCADTEAGQTYIGKSGEVVHRNRQNLWLEARSRTSQATFGDAHSAASLKYVADGFSLIRDSTRIRNPVSATRSGGITYTASDPQLIVDRYGERGWSAPAAYDSNDNVMAGRASYFLGRYKDLGTRLAGMTIKPRTNASGLWPEALGREIGDRITIQRTPLGEGNEIATEQIIEGVTHTFTPFDWTTTFRASPAETKIYWILGDATYSVLGSTTRLAY